MHTFSGGSLFSQGKFSLFELVSKSKISTSDGKSMSEIKFARERGESAERSGVGGSDEGNIKTFPFA